jgi:pimeloyl-ACP methyl ester carboxylesterase
MPARHDTQIERRRALVGPATIAYEVAGAGPPLVLVHGLSGSSRWWARNVGPLARRFRVYVVDLIGFGASRGPHPFVLSEAAGLLARWMEQIGVERAGVVGHSMGGFIAAELAADFPALVERLVLVDAAALPFNHSYLRHTFNLAHQVRDLPLSFLPLLFADALLAGPLTIARAARQLLTTDIRPKLARIQAPVLLVWGERDHIVPPALGRQLHQALARGTLVLIQSAGHNPMWDCPAAFNRVVLDFLAADAPSAGGMRQVDCRSVGRDSI